MKNMASSRFDSLEIGQSASDTRKFNSEDVVSFARISGDNNPVHLNQEFASQTIFRKPIVHGFLYSSMLSAVIANDLPGPGSIYISQELNFIAPVYHGDTLTAKVEIIQLRKDKQLVTLKTVIFNEKGNEVLTGQALVKLI